METGDGPPIRRRGMATAKKELRISPTARMKYAKPELDSLNNLDPARLILVRIPGAIGGAKTAHTTVPFYGRC